MVIVKLQGGLGNQMFQYATGRRLAHRLETDLKLDIAGFKHYPTRSYGLGCFTIQETVAEEEERKPFLKKSGIFDKILKLSTYHVIREQPAPSFIPQVLTVTGNVYLDGYWQSEIYFKDFAETIRHEFRLKKGLNDFYEKNLQTIERSASVGIHIRRGDYVTNATAEKLLGACPVDYYAATIKELERQVGESVFYVFSDDLDWAKENLSTVHPIVFIDARDQRDDAQELFIMSRCKHHIIANSSYSWWAAWLNPHLDKVVCAPKRWFKGMDYDTNIIIPSHWQTL